MSERGRIVLAEDDRDVRELVVRALESEGFDVAAFEEGEACWTWLEEEEVPDVVLLDVHIPGLDGFELLDRIRDRESLAEVPVVFLSGSTSHEAIDAAAGEDTAYITKPFSPTDLRDRVTELIE